MYIHYVYLNKPCLFTVCIQTSRVYSLSVFKQAVSIHCAYIDRPCKYHARKQGWGQEVNFPHVQR